MGWFGSWGWSLFVFEICNWLIQAPIKVTSIFNSFCRLLSCGEGEFALSLSRLPYCYLVMVLTLASMIYICEGGLCLLCALFVT